MRMLKFKGETGVIIQGAAIGREIKDEHEVSFHDLSGRDLDVRVPWCIPRPLKSD